MRLIKRFKSAWIFLFAVPMWFFASACSEECKGASDCKEMQRCVSGKCEAIARDDSTEDSDGLGSTAESKDSESDSVDSLPKPDAGEASTDVETDPADSDTRSDIRGDGQDGTSCESGADCRSGHCQNDICCTSGNCCPEAGMNSDCPSAACQTTFCDGNFQCRFYNLPLGAPDLSEENPCMWENLCDGNGECLGVTYCTSGAYKGLGTFELVDDAIEENCRTSCTSDFHCNTGFTCEKGACEASSTTPKDTCALDADCAGEKCDTALGICCVSGHCCTSDATCERYGCNAETNMCFSNCRIDNSDNDDACSSLGDYHCDMGWCYDDLTDGGRWCDESSDCLSGHCDETRSQCCAEGDCCDSDDECDRMRCLIDDGNYCPQSCAPSGIDDDTLCQSGYLCEEGDCVPAALSDGEACESDETCASLHCENGHCCADGECCETADDCLSDSLCNIPTCQANHQCIYYPIPCGAVDIEGEETCMGEDLCDGFGNCVPVSDCENGFIGSSIICEQGAVATVCDSNCESDDDCNVDYHCVSGACLEDLLPGDEGCDSNLDCKDSHCNTGTSVCCESGYCCNDDDQCAEFLSECDLETYSCNFSCADDGDCEALGDYHCETPVCEPDLENGDRFCFEDVDCLSEHCDTKNGVCCVAGDCCASDNECKGFVCDADFSCATDCAGDDALCREGYYCEVDTCVPKLPNGATCNVDGDCASSHCGDEAMVCCESEKSCCADDSDCGSEDGCLKGYCTASFSCEYIVEDDDVSCSDGLFCNGAERCDSGICMSGGAPCSDESICLEVTCDEELDACVQTPVNVGQVCSEILFCIGNIAMTCTAGGICADPGTGTLPCRDPLQNKCMESICDEEADDCAEEPIADGSSCGDNPCLGEQECSDGSCVVVGAPPCDDQNLCTTDFCSNVGGQAVCGWHWPKQDGQACETDACMGDGAVCMDGACIPVEERPCMDNNICTEDTCIDIDNQLDCIYDERTLREVSCGGQITLYSYEFSREIYAYNETCPGDFSGPEVSVAVPDATGNVTVTVLSTDPARTIAVSALNDICDASTCAAHGSNTVTTVSYGGTQGFTLESPDVVPPSSMEVRVTCN